MVNVFDSVSQSDLDIFIDLAWTGFGPTSRQTNHSHFNSHGCKMKFRSNGLFRSAEASGSVSDGSTNYTPDAAVGATEWDHIFDGYIAALDWPASMFWHELNEANPEALVLLSVRSTAETWWHSIDKTILPYARMALAPEWNEGRGLLDLLERFTGTKDWDDATTMMEAYERHSAEVRQTLPRHRLLEWRAAEGWAPICRALDVPEPDLPFPWVNQRSEWAQ